jgi:hypothetical protein
MELAWAACLPFRPAVNQSRQADSSLSSAVGQPLRGTATQPLMNPESRWLSLPAEYVDATK